MSDTDGLPTLQRRWVMACVLGGFTLTNLDGAIANIALPTLAHDFSASASATIWVVNIYQLAMAVCLLPAAALGHFSTAGIFFIVGAAFDAFEVDFDELIKRNQMYGRDERTSLLTSIKAQ